MGEIALSVFYQASKFSELSLKFCRKTKDLLIPSYPILLYRKLKFLVLISEKKKHFINTNTYF